MYVDWAFTIVKAVSKIVDQVDAPILALVFR